ncbi:intradiol ring-cleavage dioxygenase [Methylobacterium sp. NEAU 140]|uniref:intradiol ring-cleavage dioxygenase n=1 Tax=Methylobacterium sp. NEAU 140 TaxID=3064945 RepID=UPI002733DD92|nr:intradiol ring-cleavage dioxygenase [Methylobacterium sp. NEAU 140]MDP4025478.1 intradiol ring-cleavage dioxygenase [Methylobacterium sp. NEAU 140]
MPFPASRRGLLAALGASAAGLMPARAASPAAPAAPDAEGEGTCWLTPQAVEGPFYRDPKLVRSDIREGRPGVPLRLALRVIEAGRCAPVAGARVDVWHCDAQGLYSGYPGQGETGADTTGQTFLRGSQTTDAAGRAGFDTIYPGWYPGRATHVHVKVFLDARTMLTGQIYFPDALSEFLYARVPAYGGRAVERTIINANDGLAADDPDRRGFCAVSEERDRYRAALVLGVDRAADGDGGPPGPGPGGPPRRPRARMSPQERIAALVPGLRRDR